MRPIALCLALLVAEQAAGAPTAADVRALRVRFDTATTAFQAGDLGDARKGFEAVAQALEPAFVAGSFRPDSTDQPWVLYASSVLMLSDLQRYKLGEPKLARDLEIGLARRAERLGLVDLAAAQWIAVGDIERFDLGDDAAALRAYERAAAFEIDGLAADGALVNLALQGVARTPGGRPEALTGAREGIPLDQRHIEAVSAVLPHLPVYASADLGSSYAQFAAAHPRSFRAVAADYASFLVTLVFRPHEHDDPEKQHDAFLRRHADDVLAVTVCELYLANLQREGNRERVARQRDRVQEVRRRLGVGATPATKSGTGTPSAFERPPALGSPVGRARQAARGLLSHLWSDPRV